MNLGNIRTLLQLQALRSPSTIALSIAVSLSSPHLLAVAPKVHTVTLGPVRKVLYTQPDATPDTKADETSTLKIRPLFVDDRQKEWTTGEAHDVTDRTFTIRRALRLNDALPTDATPHWIWQPGPWLTVDRVTGHITALHLPDFDPVLSNAVWFRDMADREERIGPRQSRVEIERLMKETGLDRQLETEGLWPQWEKGERGRWP